MKNAAAIYARFSSDLQKDSSITDQIDLCARYAAREGLEVVAKFNDRAQSGATLIDRDGLIDLERRAKAGQFNTVVVESLDRLSRDQEDLAGLYKRLKFYGVEIRTVHEGVVTPIHVGIRGLLGQMFLADLADKVRRGQSGLISQGLVPGPVAYGYRAVSGQPGVRDIDPERAEVVRRIFREYAAGKSPRTLAADLTQDGIAAPSGAAHWNYQCFAGGHLRGGIISNPIYCGQLVWGQTRQIRNPETGKTLKRAAPDADRMTIDAPHLRIVPQALWDAANAIRKARGLAKLGPNGKQVRVPTTPRASHLLSGLLKCGVCGGLMRLSATTRGGHRRMACATAHRLSTCDHRKGYDLSRLQNAVLDQMRAHLTDPELIAERVSAYAEERAKLNRKTHAERVSVEKKLAEVVRRIARLVEVIETSNEPVAALAARLAPLDRERVALEERRRLLQAETNVIELHPATLKQYRANLQTLHKTLAEGDMGTGHIAAIRAMIDSVAVHPTGKRTPYEISTYGRLAGVLGVDVFPNNGPMPCCDTVGLEGPAPSSNIAIDDALD